MTTETDIRKYIAWLILPESQEKYLSSTPIPMLDNRTWPEIFAAHDEAAMTGWLTFTREAFGDEE